MQRFIYFFGWLVHFQTPALDLSGSHAAVVKALLLNPLIFKQCATAMLTQTTNWLCCFSSNWRFRLKKYAYQGIFLNLITVLTDAEGKGRLSHINKNISKNNMHMKSMYLMHTLQAIVANFEAFDDCNLNLHEFNILNLVRHNSVLGKSQNSTIKKQTNRNARMSIELHLGLLSTQTYLITHHTE